MSLEWPAITLRDSLLRYYRYLHWLRPVTVSYDYLPFFSAFCFISLSSWAPCAITTFSFFHHDNASESHLFPPLYYPSAHQDYPSPVSNSDLHSASSIFSEGSWARAVDLPITVWHWQASSTCQRSRHCDEWTSVGLRVPPAPPEPF